MGSFILGYQQIDAPLVFISSSFLLLQVRPQFLVEPSSTTALLGKNVTFACNASGVPEPFISWKFSGGKLPRHQVTSGNLILFNVQNNATYEGDYTCEAGNKAGMDNRTVTLTVDGKFYLLFV